MTIPIPAQDTVCVLVSVQTKGKSNPDAEHSVRELALLMNTLGYQVESVFRQRLEKLHAATIIGSGKITEIHALLDFNPKISCIAFDCDISPSQQRNLEDEFQVTVMDRTTVILEIFDRRAQTREAKLQIEIARLDYLSPRLRMTSQLDRQGGGIGLKGIGETQHELNKRRIRDRVAQLRKELERIRRASSQRRNRRRGENRVALFGYTNAGKSSLMRVLTRQDVYVEDKLFATLDTKVRALATSPKILISDTVGIIRDIPHNLIASFYSTLDEARESDLLLHVIDGSDPNWEDHIAVGKKVLMEAGAKDTPYQLVFNKMDNMENAHLNRMRLKFPNALFISTLSKDSKREIFAFLTRYFEIEPAAVS